MKNNLPYLGALAFTFTGAVAAQEKPNIIFIVADDLGWGDVSFHGSTINTPNIDRIAKQGIELDRFYTAPVSSPTRAGLMTGRYPSRFGIRKTVIPPWRKYGLDENEATIANVRAENGYSNRAMLGKWHLGHGRKAYYPLNRGFTHFYGCLNGAIDYFSHHREGELDWHRNWDPSYDKGYSTDLITNEALSCIEKYSKKGPYFLYIAYNAPHSPYQAPEDEIAEHISPEEFKTLNKKDKDGYTYRAMVTRMDKGIGKILDALRKTGDLDNTLILFMSDNGGVPNLETGSTSLPLRGNKGSEWDGGVRVPAAIYWAKGFKNGRMTDQVTGFVDMLPTIVDIIGAKGKPQRPYDGISIFFVLSGGKQKIERDMYLGVGAAVNSNYKMILAGHNKKMQLKKDFLAYYPNDKYETTSRIADHKPEAKRLKEYIISYDTITPAVKELPYGQGNKGFVAPHEWKIIKP
jgi:arylsulfatase B